MSCSR